MTVEPEFPTRDLHSAVAAVADEAGVSWRDTRPPGQLIRYQADAEFRATRQLEARLIASRAAAPALFADLAPVQPVQIPDGLPYDIPHGARRTSVDLVHIPRRRAAEALWLAARVQQVAQHGARGGLDDVPSSLRELGRTH